LNDSIFSVVANWSPSRRQGLRAIGSDIGLGGRWGFSRLLPLWISYRTSARRSHQTAASCFPLRQDI